MMNDVSLSPPNSADFHRPYLMIDEFFTNSSVCQKWPQRPGPRPLMSVRGLFTPVSVSLTSKDVAGCSVHACMPADVQ